MKKVIIWIFFIYVSTTGLAQNYVPIPDTSVFWKVIAVPYPNPQSIFYYHEYFLSGDTIVNGFSYRKIYSYVSDIYCSNYKTGPFFAGGLRQEIANKKVYYLSYLPFTEYLLFDFNLNIGDTLDQSIYNLGCLISIVNSIDSVQIGNKFHKRFGVIGDTICSFPQQYYIIEGVGSTAGLFQRMYFFEGGNYLNCFVHDLDSIDFLGHGCKSPLDTCISLNLNYIENNEVKIKISPNPFFESTTITVFDDIITDSYIYDTYGIQKRRIIMKSNTVNIYKDNLNSGLYYLLLKTKSGKSASVKFIIY